jgi:hypothetical protein
LLVFEHRHCVLDFGSEREKIIFRLRELFLLNQSPLDGRNTIRRVISRGLKPHSHLGLGLRFGLYLALVRALRLHLRKRLDYGFDQHNALTGRRHDGIICYSNLKSNCQSNLCNLITHARLLRENCLVKVITASPQLGQLVLVFESTILLQGVPLDRQHA